MKPVHILLVEDNEGDIMLMEEALNNGNIHKKVSVVKDGEACLNYLRNNKAGFRIPDLILLDITLPKINGFELLKILKTESSTQHIPVVILTTSSSDEDVFRSYQNYANCYILKPDSASGFIEVVNTIENFWVSIVQLPNKMSL